MRSGLLVGWGLAGALGSAVMMAAEKPSPEYVKAMKDLGGVVQALDKAIAAEDFDAVTKHGATAIASFTVAADYWKGKADDARLAAETGKKAAQDLSISAGLKSAEGAAFAAKGITETCAGCHTAHREKAADGSFQIK